MKKTLKVFAMLFCVAALSLTTSCSKNKDEDKDPIVGKWEYIDGTITSVYSDGSTYTFTPDLGYQYCYAENGDYFEGEDMEGKWERIDDNRVGVLTNDNRWEVHEILSLTDNVMERKIVMTRSDLTHTCIETLKRI